MVIFSIRQRLDKECLLFYAQRPYHRSLQYRLRRRRNNLRRTRLWHFRQR